MCICMSHSAGELCDIRSTNETYLDSHDGIPNNRRSGRRGAFTCKRNNLVGWERGLRRRNKQRPNILFFSIVYLLEMYARVTDAGAFRTYPRDVGDELRVVGYESPNRRTVVKGLVPAVLQVFECGVRCRAVCSWAGHSVQVGRRTRLID